LLSQITQICLNNWTCQKFFGGVSVLPQKQTPAEKKEKAKIYEVTRKRAWQPSWGVQYPWVEYKLDDAENPKQSPSTSCSTARNSNSTGKITCKYCCKYESHGTFCTGSSNFKIESLKKHEESLSHKLNREKYFASSMKKDGTSESERCVEMINKSLLDKFCILFKNAHYIAKYNRPFADFPLICKLDEAKGLNIGSSYDKKAQEFVHYCSRSQKQSK
jgi:hypothetical protein